MTDKTGGSAFPVNDTYHGVIGNIERGEPGMTLRDYFAAKALPAVYQDFWDDYRDGALDTVPEELEHWLALRAYRMADAMLKVRGE